MNADLSFGVPVSNSWQKTKKTRKSLEDRKENLTQNLDAIKVELKEIDAELYQIRTRELHISEIYRLAAHHFSRLRRQTGESLMIQDISELEKWIGRARSNEGLKNIVDALMELNKYRPVDITKNIYALVQKIIIEGSYHESQRKQAKK